MLSLDTRIDERTKAHVVALSGDAGMAEIETLEQGLKKVAAARPPLVIVDLCGLKFASSIALGRFIDLHRAVTKHGGRVMLAGAGLTVSNVLRSARLDHFFEVYTNLDEALVEAAATSKAFGFEGLGH